MPARLTRWKLQQAVHCFYRGGILAYPTEAVYGLGCDPLNAEAVYRLLELKQRPVEKGLILVADNFDQLKPFVKILDEQRMQQVLDSWPGPNTWLLPARPETPYWLTGLHSTLAVRVTDHPHTAALCRACQSPLVSTSANAAGKPPARSALMIRQRFGGAIDCLINMPLGGSHRPSVIRDASSGKVLRA